MFCTILMYAFKHLFSIYTTARLYTAYIIYKTHDRLIVIFILDHLKFLYCLLKIWVLLTIFRLHIYNVRAIHRTSVNKEILTVVSYRVTCML